MKTKTLFYCTDCGNELLKWQGRCPACGAWNTIVEQPAGGKSRASALSGPGRSPKNGGQTAAGNRRFRGTSISNGNV